VANRTQILRKLGVLTLFGKVITFASFQDVGKCGSELRSLNSCVRCTSGLLHCREYGVDIISLIVLCYVRGKKQEATHKLYSYRCVCVCVCVCVCARILYDPSEFWSVPPVTPCMYVCIYIYIYTHTHTYTYIHTHTHIHTYIHTYIYILCSL